MEEQIAKFERIGEVVIVYGQDVVLALVILVVGLIATKMLHQQLRNVLLRFTSNVNLISIVSNIFFTLMLLFVIAAALRQAGMETIIIRRILAAITLGVVGLIIIFRPYIPTLPFKVGNTIKTGDLLGRVEATTFLNTRLRTFDGKTVFVPNGKILNDYVINFHYTPNRRFELDIGIRYDQDILKAKQILEIIMIEDSRVLPNPRPVVYVTNLADSCVELSGRGWVKNLKYWKTKCDLLEKAKLRFDREGITIAYPQRDVHIYHESASRASPGEGYLTSDKNTSEPTNA